MIDDDPLNLLRQVAQCFRNEMQAEMRSSGASVTSLQARILSVIARLPGCSLREIAETTGCDKAQVSKVIKDLGSRLLLRRREHEIDWRASRLFLTDEGEDLCRQLEVCRNKIGAKMLGELTQSERDALTSILRKIVARPNDRF